MHLGYLQLSKNVKNYFLTFIAGSRMLFASNSWYTASLWGDVVWLTALLINTWTVNFKSQLTIPFSENEEMIIAVNAIYAIT